MFRRHRLCTGLLTFGALLVGGREADSLVPAIVGIPLIVVIARFPMVLDNGEHGVEVGFDSTILMFLLCTIDVDDAIVIWSVGVILTQVTTDKRLSSKLFNIGVGILAGACSAGVLVLARGEAEGTPRELIAVALAAACYFALAAVVYRTTPWWMLSLLAVPVVTLLVATRALTRGRENARRLTVLFDAAVGAQTRSDPGELVDSLLEDARALVRLSDVPLRSEPPGRGEIGAQVRWNGQVQWIVAQATERARSTVSADEQALKALAAVAAEAFARLELTAEVVHVARHDPLTDLPNRGILLDRLSQALRGCRRNGTRVALIFLDLDGFKPVNDRFGHAAGDVVLVELAGRLLSCVREDDTVARLGGDEFAVLIEDADRAPVDVVCDRVLASVQEGVTSRSSTRRPGASTGPRHWRDGAGTGPRCRRTSSSTSPRTPARSCRSVT